MERVEFTDSRDEGIVGQCGDSAVYLGTMDGLDVGFHFCEFVHRVREAHHVNVSAEVSIFAEVGGISV